MTILKGEGQKRAKKCQVLFDYLNVPFFKLTMLMLLLCYVY